VTGSLPPIAAWLQHLAAGWRQLTEKPIEAAKAIGIPWWPRGQEQFVEGVVGCGAAQSRKPYFQGEHGAIWRVTVIPVTGEGRGNRRGKDPLPRFGQIPEEFVPAVVGQR